MSDDIRIVTETGSRAVAVLARCWVQVASVPSIAEADAEVERLRPLDIRLATITQWRLEDWGRDAPLVDPNG